MGTQSANGVPIFLTWRRRDVPVMMEDAFFIEREISLYRAMLKLYMGDVSRAAIKRLLAEAEYKLAVVTGLEAQQS
jgi:hypothetical protein